MIITLIIANTFSSFTTYRVLSIILTYKYSISINKY